jgi:hypothetical protein
VGSTGDKKTEPGINGEKKKPRNKNRCEEDSVDGSGVGTGAWVGYGILFHDIEYTYPIYREIQDICKSTNPYILVALLSGMTT